MALNIDDFDDFFCDTCHLGKQSRKPHYTSSSVRVSKPGEIIHSDVCGPMNIESPSGSRYFILFKDDFSKYRTVYFMRHKSEALSKFKEFCAMVENQTGNKVKSLRTDNGREYVNEGFTVFLRSKGVIHECTAPYTPQQNGQSERDMRTIVECARSMLLHKNVSNELWAEAVSTAVYILNRALPVKQNENVSPFEKWFGQKPKVQHCKIFGCVAYVSIPSQFRKKWDPKSKKLLFVGFEGQSKNFRLWDPVKRRIRISADVSFNEREEFLYTKEDTVNVQLNFGNYNYDTGLQNDKVNEEIADDGNVENRENIRELRDRSSIKRPDYYGPVASYYSVFSPDSYDEAIQDENADLWKEAMEEEINALKENETWIF